MFLKLKYILHYNEQIFYIIVNNNIDKNISESAGYLNLGILSLECVSTL